MSMIQIRWYQADHKIMKEHTKSGNLLYCLIILFAQRKTINQVNFKIKPILISNYKALTIFLHSQHMLHITA